ncbi:2-amino-3,7-dideoxy-D-threo-hept-6-ulosonate synthase [Streptomyces monashensis]|uniref:2-amino-4,5-dihydroxy-6-one-heptanoic acid-7-phosphate synthase n=1 Tax=Streptomyces monashensis TaxID=1678012 RepID=A0A1S2PRA3_9ACTN|nr:2-amino-3,7-dideoxy-D-threo-hept-6-ulosonate synthase [Streptomyces monashensis]OIJ96319.1 2-amino-4,5-dihydroxy-6-one-heptanoic acid-7-phosphate synthase [Streptomyces monashensis]
MTHNRTSNESLGKRIRTARLSRHVPGRLMIVPLDHSISDGTLPVPDGDVGELVSRLAISNADAVVLHKGRLRYLDHTAFSRTSLVVHLSGGTVHAADPNEKYLVASVEEALRLGADAVSVHVNLGSPGERSQISDLATVGATCDMWNVPLLAMIYPRGPKITVPNSPELISHATTLAVDLGADIVKTAFAPTASEMADIVRATPIPVVAAGGALRPTIEDTVSFVDAVMSSGAAGVAMGRNIFQAEDPGNTARRVAGVVHNHRGATSSRPDTVAA